MTALDRLAEGDEGAREELRLLREVVDCAQLVVMAQNGTNGMAITQALVREALDNLALHTKERK